MRNTRLGVGMWGRGWGRTSSTKERPLFTSQLPLSPRTVGFHHLSWTTFVFLPPPTTLPQIHPPFCVYISIPEPAVWLWPAKRTRVHHFFNIMLGHVLCRYVVSILQHCSIPAYFWAENIKGCDERFHFRYFTPENCNEMGPNCGKARLTCEICFLELARLSFSDIVFSGCNFRSEYMNSISNIAQLLDFVFDSG